MNSSLEDVSSWHLKTENGIPYRLMEGYPRGDFDPENGTAQEQYIIQASDLFAFVQESFPPMVTWGDENILFFQNKRAFPSIETMLTRRIAWAPFTKGKPCDPWGIDPDAPVKTYSEFLLLTINYTTGKPKSDPNDPETFLEIDANACGEFLMLPMQCTGNWETAAGDPVQGANVPVAQVIPEIEWTVRWAQVPREYLRMILAASMRAKLGKVNSAVMPLLLNAEPETILFAGFSFHEQYTWRQALSGGHSPVEVEMKFLEKHIEIDEEVIGHNHFWQEEKGKFAQLFLPDGNLVYRMDDLNTMFPPAVG